MLETYLQNKMTEIKPVFHGKVYLFKQIIPILKNEVNSRLIKRKLKEVILEYNFNFYWTLKTFSTLTIKVLFLMTSVLNTLW